MKIAIYTATHLLESSTSDTRYVRDGLARHFDVTTFDTPDPTLCLGADVVFVRFPKPINMNFVRQLASLPGKLVINNPAAQLRYATKHHLLLFPHLTPPTIISRSAREIRDFAGTHGPVVFKPLNRHKGQGVRRFDIGPMSENATSRLIENYMSEFGEPVVQPFLECVTKTGDKRINVFGFEAISAVVTLPLEGSFICHEAAGGSALPAEISDHDNEIVNAIMPFLRANDIWWAAVDIVGDYLGEINIVTPSMVWRADRAHNNTRGMDAICHTLLAYASTLEPTRV